MDMRMEFGTSHLSSYRDTSPRAQYHSFDPSRINSADGRAPRSSRSGHGGSDQNFSSLPANLRLSAPERRRRVKKDDSDSEWSPYVVRKPSNYSEATVENARYRPGGEPTSDHPNEDRFFSLEQENSTVFAVFDGHDGSRAVGFVSSIYMEYFKTDSWRNVTAFYMTEVEEALREFFRAAETEFFKTIRSCILEKNRLQAVIPKGMRSYEAYLSFPWEVARLQELEPKLSGGCTAVVAVLCKSRLYVANVGDSRAVLVYEEKKGGTLRHLQLSTDHGVENRDELSRLGKLGLDPRQLERNGRLGSQENTRSIGDYYIKEGYKDVDTLSCATGPPGTAEPAVMVAPPSIDPSQYRYLLLMSDGVYKSIEAVFNDPLSAEANKVLLNMILNEEKNVKDDLSILSSTVLDRIRRLHHDTYQKSAKESPSSPNAVNCRKRDDMTLLIYKFPFSTAV